MKRYIRGSTDSIPTITSLEKLQEELESGNYSYYAFRCPTPQNVQQISRGYLDPSFDWDLENDVPSDEPLDGTSGLVVSDTMSDKAILSMYRKALKLYGAAYRTEVLLIGGEYGEEGYDEDEIIISGPHAGADVVAYVKL